MTEVNVVTLKEDYILVSVSDLEESLQIIDELEPTRRGIYGGAIGYFSFSGELDTGIILRTIVFRGNTAYVQAGAGIVAESNPTYEWNECRNKAMGLVRALESAERGEICW